MRPYEFVGIEFGGVARKPLDVQALAASEQGADIGAVVNGAAVPDYNDVLPKVAEKSAEENGDLHVCDVVRVEVDIETEPATTGTDGDGRDRRDAVVAVSVPHDRRLASRGPGPPYVGNQQEPGLVQENERGVQAPGFFLMAAHRYRLQCAMAASSRSNARRSGFWHDQPNRLSNRPTCARCSSTPNSRRITVAIRRVVHSSVVNPDAVAPWSNRRGSFFNCFALNFGGRPEAGRACSASGPRRLTRSRHKMTELCEQPRRRATSVIDAPPSNSAMACRRRRSSSCGLPCGLIPKSYNHHREMSITYAHVNKRKRSPTRTPGRNTTRVPDPSERRGEMSSGSPESQWRMSSDVLEVRIGAHELRPGVEARLGDNAVDGTAHGDALSAHRAEQARASRIDSPVLLPGGGSLPHEVCYPLQIQRRHDGTEGQR